MMKPAPPQLKKRRPRVKSTREQPTPPPPLTVTVVSVVWLDANRALWTFSSPLASDPEQIDGLMINGQLPGGADGETPEGAVYILYDDPISPGDPWTCDPAGVVAHFANGGTLAGGSGVVS